MVCIFNEGVENTIVAVKISVCMIFLSLGFFFMHSTNSEAERGNCHWCTETFESICLCLFYHPMVSITFFSLLSSVYDKSLSWALWVTNLHSLFGTLFFLTRWNSWRRKSIWWLNMTMIWFESNKRCSTCEVITECWIKYYMSDVIPSQSSSINRCIS